MLSLTQIFTVKDHNMMVFFLIQINSLEYLIGTSLNSYMSIPHVSLKTIESCADYNMLLFWMIIKKISTPLGFKPRAPAFDRGIANALDRRYN